jgi:hypothetical protein
MRETRSSGSVEGVVSNHDPYSDWPEATWEHQTAEQPCFYWRILTPLAAPRQMQSLNVVYCRFAFPVRGWPSNVVRD